MNRLWYLATPYSRYPDGIEAAFEAAAQATGLLIRARVPVFSPIVHTHSVAILCGMNPYDHTIWMPADEPMMAAATGLIICKLTGYDESYGIGVELENFRRAGKPVVWMNPGVVPDFSEFGE